MQLMCRGEIDIEGVERRFAIDFGAWFAETMPRLRQLAEDGLLTLDRSCIAATSHGRFLLRIIAMAFDRYIGLSPAPEAAPRYSKAI